MNLTAVQVRDLHFRYDLEEKRDFSALRNIRFELPSGKCLALVGGTGSGKSTLLQHLNGILSLQQGEISLFGRNISGWESLRDLRRKVGLVFQRPEDQLFEHYLADDIGFAPLQFGCERRETARRVKLAMTQAGLDFSVYRDREIHTLSGGERRKAGIAGVLAMQPDLLLLDEPTAGLDPHGRREMIELFLQLKQAGRTIVIASHHLEEVAALADFALVLEKGEQIWLGPAADLFPYLRERHSRGYTLPAVLELAEQLRRRGVPIPRGIINSGQLKECLRELVSGKGGEV